MAGTTRIRRRRFVWLALAGLSLVVLGAIAIAERAALARFDRVTVGMSEAEVVSILGPPETVAGPYVRLWSSSLNAGLAVSLDEAGNVTEKQLGPIARPSSLAFRVKGYIASLLHGRWPQAPTTGSCSCPVPAA